MKTTIKHITLLFFLLLSGCTSVKITDYNNEKPSLILEDYLNGTLDAYGIFQDRSGKVVKRFDCVIKASWENGKGTLDESFTYSDGSKSKRIWTLTKTTDGKYIGTADDVKGEAIGQVSGNAFQWKYILKLDVDGTTYNVNFDDWMFLMNDTVMLNRSDMSKFGIHLGTVTLTFIKRKI